MSPAKSMQWTGSLETNRRRITLRRELPFDQDKLLYTSLDEAIAYLTELRAKYPHAEIEDESEDYVHSDLALFETSPETDEEYNTRVKREEKAERNRALALEQKRERRRARLEADRKAIDEELRNL